MSTAVASRRRDQPTRRPGGAISTAVGSSAFTRSGPGWRYRVESIPIRRLRGFAVAAGLMAATGVVQAVNMMSAPGRRSGEGLLMTRAWIVESTGSLGRATDWYDHPPLGWLTLSAWTSLTGALDRAPSAVGAGRELMLVAQVIAGGLVWILARRLGLARWAGALAVALFGLSPLALELHRQVALDNLAVPWVLGAFVLVSSPRRHLAAFAAGGACLAVAVLTNEAALLLSPMVVWQAWRTSLPSTRRYSLVVGGSLFLLVTGVYVVGAGLNGELVAGSAHGGLLDGIWFQLTHSGSTRQLLDSSPFDLDALGLTALVLGAAAALVTVPRLRPIAAAALLCAALALGPVDVRPALVIELLPLGALAVAGVVQQGWRRWAIAWPYGRVAGAALCLAIVGVTVASWQDDTRQLLDRDDDAALRDAQAWIVDNVPYQRVLLVDDAMQVDLVRAGFPSEQVDGYAQAELSDDLGPRTVRDWRDYRVLVATGSVRTFAGGEPLEAALDHSVRLAAFGQGHDRVEIRRIVAEGPVSVANANDHDMRAAAEAGAALARNPSIEFAPAARDALTAGEVDERLMTTLVALAVDHRLQVSEFPVDRAEAGSGAPRRQVELQVPTPAETDAIADLLDRQEAPYRPAEVDVGPGTTVTVTYLPAALIQ